VDIDVDYFAVWSVVAAVDTHFGMLGVAALELLELLEEEEKTEDSR
jgi:hypothetical protein